MKKSVMKVLSFLLTVITVAMTVVPFLRSAVPTANAALAGNFHTGDIIEYGFYPQSKVMDSSLKATLGEQPVNADGDVFFEGARYRRYKPSNTTEFYLYEPIQWQVLSNGLDGLYVMSVQVLDMKGYHSSLTNDIKWETSTLRSWLNNTFFQQAFCQYNLKNGIRYVKLINDNSPVNNIDGGNSTQDYVFIPSYYDVINTQYGFSSSTASNSSRTSTKTAFAASKGGGGYWWLRTPAASNLHFCCVSSSFGEVFRGKIADYQVNAYQGIRPAIKLNLNATVSASSIYTSAFSGVASDSFEIRVFNTAGDAIQGAEVTIKDSVGNNKTKTTNKNGTVKFTGGGVGAISIGSLQFTVTASGYKKVSSADGDVAVSRGGFCAITMYTAEESNYKLKKALYEDTNSSYVPNGISKCNLLTGVKKLSTTNAGAGYFRIACESGNPSQTLGYTLYQGSNQLAVSADGIFNLRIAQLQEGGNFYVVTTAKDGKKVSTNLNLQLQKDLAVKETNIKIGDKISIALSDDIPFVGGSTLSLDIPDMPVEIAVENGKAYIGFNAKLYDSNGKKSISEQYQKIKETMADVKKLSHYKAGSNLDRSINNFLKKRDKFKLPVTGAVEVKFFGGGTYEWTDSFEGKSLSFDLFLLVNASLEKNWQTMVTVVPVTIQLKVGVEGKLSASVKYNYEDSSLNGDVALNLKPYLNAFGGVGVGKWIGVGVYGDANADFKIQLIGTTISPGLQSVDLTGEMGIKAYAGPLTYKKDFAYNTWHLYQRHRGASLAPAKNGSVSSGYAKGDEFDTDNYTLHDLSYLAEESGWLGSSASGGRKKAPAANGAAATIHPLLTSTYRNAQPMTVANGDSAVMGFLSADTNRNAYNASKAVYTVYDADNGTWSAPAAFDTDGTADGAPYLYADSTGLFAAYQNTATTFDETTFSDSAYAAAQTIAVANWNAADNTFVTARTYASSGAYDRAPQIVSVGGIPTLVWLSCADADLLGQAQSTDILYAQNIDGAWSDAATLASGLHSVADYAAGEVNGTPAVMAITDADDDFATSDDRTLSVITSESTATVNVPVTTEPAEEGEETEETVPVNYSLPTFAKLPSSDGNRFLFIANGNLYSTTNGSNVEEVIENVGSPESLAYLSDRIVATLARENNSDIYSFEYDPALGTYGTPVALTEQDAYIERLSGVTLNGTDLVTMTRKSVTITEGDVDDDCELAWMTLGEKHDLSLDSVNYSGTDVKVGYDLPIYLGLTNNGTDTVNTVTVTIKDADGTVLSTQNHTVDLLPGASMELESVCTMAGCAEQQTYTVSVTDAAGTDDNTANNSQPLTVGCADVSVNCEMMKIGNMNTMAVIVQNDGIGPIDGVLDIWSSENDELPLASFPIGTMGGTERQIIHYDFDPDDFTSGSAVITCTFTGNADELYTENNTDTASVDFTVVSVPVCGVRIASEGEEITEATVTENRTLQLTAKVIPENADNQAVNWFSSDETIATVDTNGLVHTLKPGSVTITARTAENSFENTVVLTVECDHNFDITVTDPDCVTDGERLYTCSICGFTKTETIPATGHTAVTDAAVVPTCVRAGLTVGEHCSVCGTVLTAQETIPANGHDFAVYRTDDPACLTAGKKYFRCNVCDYEMTEEIAALGHNYVEEPSLGTAATCTTPGTKGYICTRCEATKNEPLSLAGHTAVTDPAIPATCTTSGLTEGSHCSVCGVILTAQTQVRATGHHYVTDSAIPATCTEDGWTEGKHCEYCGTVAKEPKLIEATGHVPDPITDCTADTLCSVCGEVAIPAGAHTVTTVDAVAPTCIAAGSTAGEYCTVCGCILSEIETVAPLGHEYVIETVAPTCIDKGYTVHTCSCCGDRYVDNELSHLGHTYVLNYTEATCTSDGLNEMRCSVCNEGYTAVLPATGHNYFEIVVAPTCTVDGYTRHICARCSDEYTDSTVTASGHSFYEQTITPTCTENGCDINICSVCGFNYTDNVVAAPGHRAVRMAAVAPTCSQPGHTEMEYCMVCEEILVHGDVIPCTDHTDEDADQYCDECGGFLGDCDCICHRLSHNKNVVAQFMYKLICCIWKAFRINQYCSCGCSHW